MTGAPATPAPQVHGKHSGQRNSKNSNKHGETLSDLHQKMNAGLVGEWIRSRQSL